MSPVDELFFASELFQIAAQPGVTAAWRRLQMGDADGAVFFADALTEAEAGIAGLAQIRAAIAVVRGDAAAAATLLRDVLPQIGDAAAVSAISFQYGLCAWSCGDVDAARAAFASAADAADAKAVWAAWARCERVAGEAEAAWRVLERGLGHHPDHLDLLNLLAAWHLEMERFAEALAVLDRLPAVFADHPVALVNRGNALRGLSRLDAARDCFRRALTAAPTLFEARFGLALSVFDAGDDGEAEPALRAALAQKPDHPEVVVHLARLLARTHRVAEAKDYLAAMLERVPDCFAAHYRFAMILLEDSDFEEAEAHALIALGLRPDADELHDLLGLARLSCGDFEGARRSFEIAAAMVLPQASAYSSNRIYAQHYDPRLSAVDVFAAHRAYGACFGGIGTDPNAVFANPPDPGRRLRVGYVSPDYRAHSVAFFMMAPVEGHHRDRFEVFAYSNAPRVDAATRWFRESFDHWRDVSALDFDGMRRLIRDDGIDILVDLAGHTGDNLLPLFARRAAPVQVNYLGYPNTTGLAAMDYRIVDAITDPPGGADALASERLIRLPRVFLCYRPTADLPPVAPGPLAADLPMTFGSFNTAMKLNDPLFDAWGEILRAVPDARLLLKAKQFSSRRARDRVQEALAARGVAPERLTIMAFAPTLGAHLGLYSGIDLALDTFPYNGTTTTCEALSMGVPVLSLKGGRHCARVGESLLSATGLAADFLADDVDDYVRRAIAWAARRGDLAVLRGGMRQRLLASPLCDETGFVAALEDALRAMWGTWCAAGPRGGLGPSPFETELRARRART